MKLPPYSVYISPIDLNIEHGEIEIPYKPTVKFSTPIYINGKNIGMLIINYLADNTFDDFKKIAQNDSYDSEILLLNSDGNLLESSKFKNNWKFIIDPKIRPVFPNKYPYVWQKIKEDTNLYNSKQLIHNGYIFTFKPVNLRANSHFAKLRTDVTVNTNNVYIISITKINSSDLIYFNNEYLFILKDIFLKNIPFFLLSFLLLAMIFIYLIYAKNQRLTYFNRAKIKNLNNIFTRNDGLNIIQEIINNTSPNSLALSLIKINGLKEVNSVLGYEHGDNLLSTVSQLIISNINNNDFCVRVDGDEFLIIFNDKNSSNHITTIEKILAKCKTINDLNNNPYIISLIYGTVAYNEYNITDINSLLDLANMRMNKQKVSINEKLKSVIK